MKSRAKRKKKRARKEKARAARGIQLRDGAGPGKSMDREDVREALVAAGLREGLSVRSGVVRPGTFDAEAGSCRFVATTELPATVWDWERWDFVREVLVADGMILPDSGRVPVLDTHSRASIDDLFGSAGDFQRCDVEGYPGQDCQIDFSADERAAAAKVKVEEGHLTDVSVGYEVLEPSYYIPEGEKQLINGKEYEGPLKVSTRWAIKELSLVPIGADRLAKVRALVGSPGDRDSVNNNARGENMKKCPDCGKDFDGVRCECGHRADSGAGDGGRAPETPATPPAPAAQPVDNEQVKAEAVAAERKRTADILDAVSVAGLGEQRGREFIAAGMDMDQVRKQILDDLAKKSTPVGAGAGITVETEARDKFRNAAADALSLRSGISVDAPAVGAQELRGRSMLHIVRQCLVLAGERVEGLSRREVVSRALASGSTSDFPALMSALANKHLIGAYDEAPSTWRPIVTVTDATDFKDIHGIELSGAPDLLPLNENGEYRTAKLTDSKESYRVVTKGIKIIFTRQMIINDDLRAFTRGTRLFGDSARRMESDAVYSLILSNPDLSDGNALFSAVHKNLEETGANLGAVDADNLKAGRSMMRKQKGTAGANLDIMPEFLLVPTAQEMDSEILLRSATLPVSGMPAGTFNPHAGKLTPIAEPRLDDVSTEAWYLFASPNRAPVIEVAFLEGEEQPYIEERVNFDSDALELKVRHDFGAGLVGSKGAFMNPGSGGGGGD